MLKTACLITGDNYTIVANDTPASKKKIIALGTAVLLPVTIWLFNGFVLSYQVLKTGIACAIVISIVCATIVFLIEKLIVMANGNGWLTLIRVLIGLIIALLGSIALDEVIFKREIDTGMPFLTEEYKTQLIRKTEMEFKDQHNYRNLETSIANAQVKYDSAFESAIHEADGTTGTKAKGVGQITKFKSEKAKERKADLNELLREKQALDVIKDSLLNATSQKVEKSFDENGLLVRVKALFDLISGDKYMVGIYTLLSTLMFFFEFFVVILKLTLKKTNYERRIELIEEIGQRRIEQLKQKDIHFADPGFSFKELKDTKMLLDQRSKVFS
jgi:hypothetical protein